MDVETTLDVVDAYVAALAAKDPAAMSALRADDFVLDWVHGDAFEQQPLTKTETEAFWPSWFEAFSEMDLEVTRTIAGESVAVTQWVFVGVHTQPFGPPVFDPLLPPSGRTIRLRGVSVYDLRDGCIYQETTYLDLATLMVELGVRP